jgi:hypothetical protein
MILYPLTDIVNPGAISNGKFENSARLAACLELMLEMSEFRRVSPSPDLDDRTSVALASPILS